MSYDERISDDEWSLYREDDYADTNYEYAVSSDQGCDTIDYSFAVISGVQDHIGCLKNALGPSWTRVSHSATALAAEKGHLECMQYIDGMKGFDWCEDTTLIAAKFGHYDCLKYAAENGAELTYCGDLALIEEVHGKVWWLEIPWFEGTTSYIVSVNKLECLKYVIANGCAWDEETVQTAAAHGSTECLRYCLEMECPYDICSMDATRAMVLDICVESMRWRHAVNKVRWFRIRARYRPDGIGYIAAKASFEGATLAI